ncbi:MAG: phosphatidylserine decarboxylase family protein [Candidatus Heimdallarchaeota archaeon]|nr:phosphatidylserine decarboxylase family protein [Candidatus Heimdallarchaeota archaeon]
MFAPRSEGILLFFTALTAISMLFVPLSWFVLIPFSLGFVFTIFILYFFRDPKRVVPEEDEGILVAPADGVIRKIVQLEEKGTTQVQILLSVFNVHVNRMPLDSKLINLSREKKGHWPAWFKGKYVDNNARLHYDLEATEGFSYRITQIAGIFAWRCVSYVEEGETLKQNDKFGIIRFGSQANLELPDDCGYELTIKVGDKIRAGESIIARRK